MTGMGEHSQVLLVRKGPCKNTCTGLWLPVKMLGLEPPVQRSWGRKEKVSDHCIREKQVGIDQGESFLRTAWSNTNLRHFF